MRVTVEVTTLAWIGFAIPHTPRRMVGAYAIVCLPDTNNVTEVTLTGWVVLPSADCEFMLPTRMHRLFCSFCYAMFYQLCAVIYLIREKK